MLHCSSFYAEFVDYNGVRLGGIETSFSLQVKPALFHRASRTSDKLSGDVDAKVASGGRAIFDALQIDNLAGRDISIRFHETVSQLQARTERFSIYPFAMEPDFSADDVVAGQPVSLSVRTNDQGGRVRRLIACCEVESLENS